MAHSEEIPGNLVGYLRKRVRDSLDPWTGSEADKALAADRVITHLVKSLPPESAGADKRARNKELSERATSVSQVLIHRAESSVVDCLLDPEKPIDIHQLLQTSMDHVKKNRDVFAKITDRHHELADLDKQGTKWEDAVKKTESSLVDYAVAATLMGEKDWVKIGNSWMASMAKEFFTEGGAKRHYVKLRKVLHFAQHGVQMTPEQASTVSQGLQEYCLGPALKPAKLLDVGSCYNPFLQDRDFDVTALDLCPSHASVYNGDFLTVEVGDKKSVPVFSPATEPFPEIGNEQWQNARFRVQQLPAESFDVVTLSLVLSYLPGWGHRHRMIAKARELLVASDKGSQHPHRAGILIIAEKESIMGKEDNLLKQWKEAITDMGFSLYRYSLLNTGTGGKKVHGFVFVRTEREQCGTGLSRLYIKSELSTVCGDSE